ncbi:ABC transporter ATP-binding protein [Ethanoligenens harbinense]|nr:ABC transporter ATP-binding protein [Ethanoligenens harbinense]AVQ97420.1 teichoic acid ABC transporter ATP-binding protein [Ethanoligenens harbinense YUAN-3]AYF40076.1 teichoic acid ABC transporter ATP-binding protein [Ethanoligenens harbinense]AYF42908.1 teichoic acid ABC transporter ATP-binding protein [Ethanoligenens harbinense]QCN93673.1 ABC transporter ATP-binding protein [Ethanoligenens harbinense]
MIKVENVSMRFNLGKDRVNTLKEFLIRSLKHDLAKKEEFWALRDISFEVPKGEVLGLVGTNGAGKSTLLKVISGVMKPTAGKVELHGTIAPMIELGAGFDMELTAKENVFLNGSILGYSKQFLQEKYQEIVDFSELSTFMDVPVRNFSSGMVARLAFAIATLVAPQILIVDEILSVGDPPFQQKSQHKMMDMIHGGATVVFVSHSMQDIKRLCKQVLWLDHGHMKMLDDTDAVLEAYADFCHLEQE